MCIDTSMRPYRYMPASLHIVFSMSFSASGSSMCRCILSMCSHASSYETAYYYLQKTCLSVETCRKTYVSSVGFSMLQVQYLQMDTVGFSMVQVQYLQLQQGSVWFRFSIYSWTRFRHVFLTCVQYGSIDQSIDSSMRSHWN